MLNILKTSNNILKNNLILIQPLLLFLLIFMTALSYLAGKNMFFIPKIVLGVSIILLFIAFSSGWFYIIKNSTEDYSENDSKDEIALKSIKNFKKFFEGVGKGFFKSCGAYILSAIIYFAVMYCVIKLCLHFFGIPDFIYEFQKMTKAASQAELLNIIDSVSVSDKLIFSVWVVVINIISSVLNFFVLLYLAVINFEKENIFKALGHTILFGFKNIFGAVFILLFTFILYLILNILSLLFGTGVFGLFVMIVLFCWYLTFYVILVFCFYNERTKDNSNNRTEFVG